ncbi:MAG TPA: polysaccharide deacetylase family protein, partial [Spirochaetia bacterium]|nr:polysaccharide deacetylase family protein [Spirochaetia bacterium]
SFSGLNLSPKDRVLFTASVTSPEAGPYDTLFLADAATRKLRQLTFFPEQVLLLQDGDVLQIQNRFGVFRSSNGFTNIAPLPLFPSFVAGNEIAMGKLAPMATSPDGRYLMYLDRRSPAYGQLIMVDVAAGTTTVISDRVELDLQELPALWSPDSQFIVYAKGGGLYYFSLAQLQQKRVLTEALRRMGDGTVASVRWAGARTLYYIDGTTVYSIDPSELSTRALYTGFLDIGTVVGRIPFSFNANFDAFWISPDAGSLLLDVSGGNLLLAPLTNQAVAPRTMPYLWLPRGTTVASVLWSSQNVVTILCRTRDSGKLGSAVYRIAQDSQGHFGTFQQTADQGVLDLSLSPDGSLVALLRPDGVSWNDYTAWQEKGRVSRGKALHALWLSNDEILIAGSAVIERYTISTAASVLVAVSQPGPSGFTDADGVQMKLADQGLAFDEGAGGWSTTAAFSVRDTGLTSDNYRVYLEDSTRGSYRNLVMVRDAKGFGTVPLFPLEATTYEAFPAVEEKPDLANFSHGSRLRRREVSLVFNAADGAEGLTGILNTLSSYGIRATFFENGQFIRRNPDAVVEIAASGHEVGSLFSSYFNLTDSRYAVDAAFIKAGLARTEDDYFATSGRELSLLWHAPYYIVNSSIITAAATMNYVYVGRDLDTYDGVPDTEANRQQGLYKPAADLVERIIGLKKPGSIIAVQIGTGMGQRSDYLFQKLDLLINELLRRGYSVVPVSTLIEHAR